jgi:hypothetical protein
MTQYHTTAESDQQRFNAWKSQVNHILAAKLGGLNSDDLPDCPYRDWFDDRMSPRAAAAKAIRNARDS